VAAGKERSPHSILITRDHFCVQQINFACLQSCSYTEKFHAVENWAGDTGERYRFQTVYYTAI